MFLLERHCTEHMASLFLRLRSHSRNRRRLAAIRTRHQSILPHHKLSPLVSITRHSMTEMPVAGDLAHKMRSMRCGCLRRTTRATMIPGAGPQPPITAMEHHRLTRNNILRVAMNNIGCLLLSGIAPVTLPRLFRHSQARVRTR